LAIASAATTNNVISSQCRMAILAYLLIRSVQLSHPGRSEAAVPGPPEAYSGQVSKQLHTRQLFGSLTSRDEPDPDGRCGAVVVIAVRSGGLEGDRITRSEAELVEA